VKSQSGDTVKSQSGDKVERFHWKSPIKCLKVLLKRYWKKPCITTTDVHGGVCGGVVHPDVDEVRPSDDGGGHALYKAPPVGGGGGDDAHPEWGGHALHGPHPVEGDDDMERVALPFVMPALQDRVEESLMWVW
jgi:hypothetical protein